MILTAKRQPRHVFAGAVALLALVGAAAAAQARDITIRDGKSSPESVAALPDGTVFAAGQNRPVIFRAEPGDAVAEEWIVPRTAPGGITHGVMPDARAGLVWTCVAEPVSAARGAATMSSLLAFDLKTGVEKARYVFDAPGAFFNDVSLAPDGTPYITDSRNARIMRLDRKTGRIEIWAHDAELLAQPNGLAFVGAVLYVGVHRGDLIRIPLRADGSAGPMTAVKLSRLLEHPDGMRAAGAHRLVVSENPANLIKDGPQGRGTLITLDGDTGAVTVLKSGLWGPAAAGAFGDTALILETKLEYHSDPAVLGQDPGPITIHAVPLPKE